VVCPVEIMFTLVRNREVEHRSYLGPSCQGEQVRRRKGEDLRSSYLVEVDCTFPWEGLAAAAVVVVEMAVVFHKQVVD
jgi:hypothetical protein